MSLINQALRKAQRDRSPKRLPNSGSGASAHSSPGGPAGMKPGLIIGLVVTVAVLFGLVVGLTLVIFKGNDTQAVTQQSQPGGGGQAATQQPETKTTAEQVAANKSDIEPVVAQQSGDNAEKTSLAREATPAVVDELRKAREAAEAKAQAEAKAAEEAAARAAAEPSQEVIDWLARARINGVKISDAESKVILNGKPYVTGEYVNPTLNLKVMIIQEKRVLFVDKNGKKYLKRL